MAEKRYNTKGLNQRLRDPLKNRVQLNVKVPWDFREYLYIVATNRGTTISKVVTDALFDKYLTAFEMYQIEHPPKTEGES